MFEDAVRIVTDVNRRADLTWARCCLKKLFLILSASHSGGRTYERRTRLHNMPLSPQSDGGGQASDSRSNDQHFELDRLGGYKRHDCNFLEVYVPDAICQTRGLQPARWLYPRVGSITVSDLDRITRKFNESAPLIIIPMDRKAEYCEA